MWPPGCRSSRRLPGMCARRCARRLSSIASTSRATATICPRCAIGSGSCEERARIRSVPKRPASGTWRSRGGTRLVVTAGHSILCVNRGSSSLKFSLYMLAESERLLASGEIDRIGMQGSSLRIVGEDGGVLKEIARDYSGEIEIVRAMFAALAELDLPRPAAAGHRVVHGGAAHA